MEEVWKEYQQGEECIEEEEDGNWRNQSLDIFTLFWIYVVGGVLGCLAETVWCRLAMGGWESRSSNLFFPISSVWGIGCVLFSMLLKHDRICGNAALFMKGYLLGGIFEFFCGSLCEKVLGVTFWDYTSIPFTLGTYVNLIFCCFWGFTAIVWAKKLYPALRLRILHMKERGFWKLTKCLAVFIVFTTLVSGFALLRMEERQSGIPAANRIESYLDQNFPDELLQKIFPKMKPI